MTQHSNTKTIKPGINGVNLFSLILILAFFPFAMSCSKDDDSDNSNAYSNLTKTLNEVNFQGYAIVTKNGTDLVREGFGLANKDQSTPQNPDLVYRIGSVSKTLTAGAIVQLQRDGLIQNFSQTLNEFDPEFPNGDLITIAHLLSHQSGIPEHQLLVEQSYANGNPLDVDDIYELITDKITQDGLNFTPGTGKQYCNSNYLIAAMLVEQLSGKSFHEYMKEKMFNPLGMLKTGKGNNEIDINTHAQGYFNGISNSNYFMTIPFGSGDISSTPSDMETWVNAVKTTWYSEAEKANIFTQNVPSGYVDFGLGWFTTQEGNTTMYWHGGDINGYWSMIGFIPEYDATIVLLSNHQDDTGEQRNTILNVLLKNEFSQ